MKKYYSIILICLTLIVFTNCVNKKSAKKYYIISQHYCYGDTFNFSRDSIPPPPPPPGKEWYTNLIFLFDSTDRVYLYQTINKENFDSARKYNSNIELTKYPNYIGLQPYHLISFTNENFINFIKNNNDILELDTAEYSHNRLIYIASNKDTIKNKAYYELLDLIKSKSYLRKHRNIVCFMIRKTTEEENKVIYYKRKNILYNPEEIKWSANFINGNCRPFTKEYDSIEKRMFYIIKAFKTLDKDCTYLPRIL